MARSSSARAGRVAKVMWALLGVELKRTVASSRFGWVMLAMGVFAVRIVAQMHEYALQSGLRYNAWDAFIGLFGGTASSLPPAVVYPLLVVWLVGATVRDDVSSRYADLLDLRTGSPVATWCIKVVSTLLSVTAFVAAAYASALVAAVISGLPAWPAELSAAGGSADAWTRAQAVPPVYYSLLPGTSVVLHGAKVAGYMVAAYSAFALFVIGMTVRSRHQYAPLGVAALSTASGLALSYASSPLSMRLSLSSAFIESTHRPIPVADGMQEAAVSWGHSLALLGGMAVLGLVAGTVGYVGRNGRDRHARHRRAPLAVGAGPLLLAAVCLCSGCTPSGLADPVAPVVISSPVHQLTAEDTEYLRMLATSITAMCEHTARIQMLWDPAVSSRSEEWAIAQLSKDVAQLERAIGQAEDLPVPAHLRQWHASMLVPVFDELRHVTDDLVSAARRHDPAAVFVCLRHIDAANIRLAEAGGALGRSAADK